jgi:hypothetical protein
MQPNIGSGRRRGVTFRCFSALFDTRGHLRRSWHRVSLRGVGLGETDGSSEQPISVEQSEPFDGLICLLASDVDRIVSSCEIPSQDGGSEAYRVALHYEQQSILGTLLSSGSSRTASVVFRYRASSDKLKKNFRILQEIRRLKVNGTTSASVRPSLFQHSLYFQRPKDDASNTSFLKSFHKFVRRPPYLSLARIPNLLLHACINEAAFTTHNVISSTVGLHYDCADAFATQQLTAAEKQNEK